MKKIEKKASVGARIVKGLEDFAQALAAEKEIAQEFTCRVIELDLRPTTYDPKMVRETRQLLKASQTVFARLLGASVKTVRAWEQGVNPPSDMACRFMDEIRGNPKYWIGRLNRAVVNKR